MKKLKTLVLGLALVVFSLQFAVAASSTASHDVTLQINEIVLIDLNNTAAITLTTNAPTAGGENPLGDTDATKLLQYTSLVATGLTRKITVAWGGTETAPAGTSLKLVASAIPAGCGTAAPQVTITNGTQDLVTGIGSCATGTGTNGAALTYTFSIDDVTQLVVGDNKTVTITFTLIDA